MTTADHIPPPLALQFWPAPPPVLEKKVEKWVLEIGPGQGELLLHLAQKETETQFAAVEIRRLRFEKIARQAEKLKLGNLHLVWGDARECVRRLFPDDFFQAIYVLFPDPWPKRRHAKHRLLKPRFVQELHALLKPSGSVVAATDADFYAEQIREAFGPRFAAESIASPFPTYFEQKWLKAGRSLDYLRFTKF